MALGRVKACRMGRNSYCELLYLSVVFSAPFSIRYTYKLIRSGQVHIIVQIKM